MLEPGNPQALNRYSYVLGNPLKYRDPSGHTQCAALAPYGPLVFGCQVVEQVMLHGPEIVQLIQQLTISVPVLPAAADPANNPITAIQSLGGNTAGPGGLDPNNWGPLQEQIVRQSLARNYQQVYGSSDTEIRQGLGVQGKVADFVGYNSRQGRWLIAESKGSDIDGAVSQLSNTMNGVLQRTGAAANAVELRIYMSASQYQRLLSDNIGGWRVQDGYLGWLDDVGQWYWANVNGIRILVEQAPH